MTSFDEIEPQKESTLYSRLSHWSSYLARRPIHVLLTAGIVGAVSIASTAILTGVGDNSGHVGVTKIGVGSRVTQDAFTRSSVGDCLQWPEGQTSSLSKVECREPHRFEVAAVLDGTVLPSEELSPTAKWPGPERFASISAEQCPVFINRYLKGHFDPQGRFDPDLMYPSEAQWDRGQRALRCGLVERGAGGAVMEITGRIADLDPSRSWVSGTCIGINPQNRQATFPVNCTEPHAFQTTGSVDMSTRFGTRTSGRQWPGIDEQNKFLTQICLVQAHRFLGGKHEFEKTTLNVQWSTISEIGWRAGSRKAVCYIGLPFKGGFATLVGDARKHLLINGKMPTPSPTAPPGRALPTPVPIPQGIAPNPTEVPAPVG